MTKKWIKIVDGDIKFIREHLLNHGANNWNLNQSYNVGKTSELIRKCSPKNLEDWEEFYFREAFQNKKNGKKITKEWIAELGGVLYVKLSEVVRRELENITLDECIDYMYYLVINRTYIGYERERETVYNQLEKLLKVNIDPAPDEMDRKYNVDFLITVGIFQIGLQIKPMPDVYNIPQIYKERNQQSITHLKFKEKFGGKVFYVYSVKKIIYERDKLINEIEEEIKRLRESK